MPKQPFLFQRRSLDDQVELWLLKGHVEPRAWASFLERASRWLVELESRGTPKSVVVDPTECEGIDSDLLRLTNVWRAQHTPLLLNACKRAAYVAERPFMRGLLTAMFWFAPPAIPVRVFRSRTQAARWLSPELSEEVVNGCDQPSRLASSHPPKDANQQDTHYSSARSAGNSEVDRPRP